MKLLERERGAIGSEKSGSTSVSDGEFEWVWVMM